MRAILTGATGFVGSHLGPMLASHGFETTAIGHLNPDDRTSGLCDSIKRLKPDIVFHLATHFVSHHKTNDVEYLIDSNLLFGTQVLEAMAQAGVKRLVNVGTIFQHPFPFNLYAATKTAFESIVGWYASTYGMKVVTLTLPDTYGPGDKRPKLMNVLKRASETGERLPMLPPNHMIDLVHIDDVCRAFLESTNLYGGRWSVSSGPVRLETVVKEFERASGKPLTVGWGERKYRPREAMEPWVGEKLPGWESRVSLREGIAGLFA